MSFMHTKNIIFKNSLWLISGEIISKGSICLLTILLARKLGVVNFGIFNFAMSVVMVLSVLTDLGLNMFLFREISKNIDKAFLYAFNIFLMRFLFSLLFLAATFSYVHFSGFSYNTAKLILLLAVWICVFNFSFIFRSAFKAMEVAKWSAIVSVIDSLMRLSFVVLLLNFNVSVVNAGVAYLIAAVISFLSGLMIFIHYCQHITFKLDFSLWLYALKEIRFLALVAIMLFWIGRFDSIIIAYLKNTEAVGLYNAAVKLVWVIMFIPALITHAAFPKLSQFATKSKEKFRDLVTGLIKVNFLLAMPVCLMVTLFAIKIINIIYGSAYIEASSVLRILIWIFCVQGINTTLIYALTAQGRQGMNVIFIGITILLNILSGIFMVHIYNYYGMAIATLSSVILLAILLFNYSLRCNYINLKNLKISKEDIGLIKEIMFKKDDKIFFEDDR